MNEKCTIEFAADLLLHALLALRMNKYLINDSLRVRTSDKKGLAVYR